MKNIILALLLVQAVLLSSCGKYDSQRLDDNQINNSYETENASSAVQAESSIMTDNEKNKSEIKVSDPENSSAEQASISVDNDINHNFDSVPVNSEIDEAVEKNSSEEASLSGYYSFVYENFNMVYSNELLEKCFQKLEDLCRNANFSLAFSYKNIDSNASISYNSAQEFLTCSTIKAPYVKSLLSDNINLDEVIVKQFNWSGDTDPEDILANMPNGKEFTARELIEYTIIDSDNTAYMTLHDYYGCETFNNTQYQLGANYFIGYDYIFTQATVDDMIRNYIDIYNFGENSDNGKWLIELMKNASYNEQIGKALGGKYNVAQKYGSDSNENAFNDCAICYADSPFVLCIFTVQPPDDDESCKIFKELAVVFDEINTLIYTD